MTRKRSLPEDAEAIAQARANADAELLADLQNRDGEVIQPEPVNPDPETTIADKVVGMADLAVKVRQRTRLGEALIGKLFETALQWHAWDYQRRAQERQMFNPFGMSQGVESSDGEGLVGPEPDEILGAAEDADDNLVPVDFTPADAEQE